MEVSIFFENENNVYPDSEYAGTVYLTGEVTALQVIFEDGKVIRFQKEN